MPKGSKELSVVWCEVLVGDGKWSRTRNAMVVVQIFFGMRFLAAVVASVFCCCVVAKLGYTRHNKSSTISVLVAPFVIQSTKSAYRFQFRQGLGIGAVQACMTVLVHVAVHKCAIWFTVLHQETEGQLSFFVFAGFQPAI